MVLLPLGGVWMSGRPISPYVEFPPHFSSLPKPEFSPAAFVLLSGLLLAFFAPWFFRQPKPFDKSSSRPPIGKFPCWGWLGIGWTVLSWILAWNRFPWFAPLQPHMFTPLWVGYILVINALTQKRSGRCIMLNCPRLFGLLFLASGVFWWFFEYLNRFARNWDYLGIGDFGPWSYFFHATISFSTVLPAVMGTMEWLQTFPGLQKFLKNGPRWPTRFGKPTARLIFCGVMGSFLGIGIRPQFFFSLLWMGPPLLVICSQVLRDQRHFLADLETGDWVFAGSAALAGLICGFFWEMWNFYSVAKWVYAVPYVHRFQIFEMPLLGYAGYLPFGLECVIVSQWLKEFFFLDPP